MGKSNKLGVFIIGVNLLLPSLAQAIVVEPIKIDSSQGEPLYAEIPFHNADGQNPIQVSIAQPFELGIPEAVDPSKVAHFNFYVRQNNQGNGVIVITSNRPIHENNLNLVLKINDNGQIHMQQLHNKLPSRIERLQSSLQETPLQPRIVVDEAALKLDLPAVSDITTNEQQLLAVQSTPPPLLNTTNPQKTESGQTSAAISVSNTNPDNQSTETVQTLQTGYTVNNNPTNTTAVDSAQNTTAVNNIGLQNQSYQEIKPEVNLTESPVSTGTTAAITSSVLQPSQAKPVTASGNTPATAVNSKDNQHKVQANESLWAIANQISKSQNVSIQRVMKDIHTNNKHAFIHGNASRLRQGTVLNIPTEYQLPAVKNTAQQKTQPAVTAQAETKTKPAAPQKQTQAHMSIVANDSQGAAQGTNKAGQPHSTQQNELTVQLKQQRSATLTLQNNVRQLDQQLREKEKRLALLNARLAELEQQLKSRQTQQAVPDVSKTQSRSKNSIPTIYNSTSLTFAGTNADFAVANVLQELT